jgi:uncharacterized integral membrane protein
VQSSGIGATVEAPEREQVSSDILAPAILPEQTEVETALSAKPNSKPNRASGSAIMDFAVLGILLGGAIGMVKATQMENPLDVLICLLGSVTGCALICFVYFRRD